MQKKRLDVLLTEQGFAPSREKAKIMLMSGIVYVNGNKEDKPGTMVDPDPEQTKIEVRGETLRYVSRGGLKLEKALKVFPIDLEGRVCMDIGASTGGFTDCMLQNGAAHVFSIDVGYGQLDWKLRNDPRVTCMEKTNFRYLKPEDLPEVKLQNNPSPGAQKIPSCSPSCGGGGLSQHSGGQSVNLIPTFASCDVSFISLSKILPAAAGILPVGSQMVCLIKPQFEAGREKVGHKGVVRDPKVHEEVILAAVGYAQDTGFRVSGLDYSPIRGPEGNIEYLMFLERVSEHSDGGETGRENIPGDGGNEGVPGSQNKPIVIDGQSIHKLVDESHKAFEQ